MESKIKLIVFPGKMKPLEKSSHPAGLSVAAGKIKSKIPYVSHKERMKFAKMAKDRMLGACAPESSSAHGKQPAVNREGRDAGQKKPHKNYATKVSGMDSSSAHNFESRVIVLKPSEMGAGKPENAKKHQPRKIPKPKQ